VKHHRPHGAGRTCHPQCKESRQLVEAGAAASIPRIRSHKGVRPDSGKLEAELLAAAAIIAPPPLLLPLLPSWQTHGWSRRSFSRTSRAAATSWLQLIKSGELKEWELKRGGYWQHDTAKSLVCAIEDEKRVRLRHGAERIARQLLSTIGMDATPLRLAAIKLLRAAPGEGEQEIHYDITEYARAIRSYTVLMYLTPTLSTAVPTLPLSELRDCFTEGERRPSAAALKLLTRDKFESVRVDVGDLLVFNCAVPHRGVANPDAHDRYVLFLLFYPSSSPTPDTEEQRYPHGVKD